MKILIVQTYHYYRGGDSTYSFLLANLLRKNGNQVNFFGMKHPLNLPCEDEKYFVDYIDFRDANANKNIVNGIKVISRSIYSTHVRKKFKTILNEIKPDIIHIQNLHGHITPSILFEAKKQNIPVVMTLHDYKFICPNTHLLSHGEICESCEGRKFYKCFQKKCKKDSYSASLVASVEAYTHKLLKTEKLIEKFISPSGFLKSKFVQYGWDNGKIEVINNFLTNDKFEDTSDRGENYVLYFGQLEPWKGVLTLLKAGKELPNIKFVILGTGSSEENLQKFKNEFNLTNIFFEGFKTGPELRTIIKNSLFIIVPSEWYENYPYSVMESMAFGKPVIASNIGGLPELMLVEQTGLLFEKGNVVNLIEKIKYLLANRTLIIKYGKNSFRFAKENFNEDIYYSKLLKLYNNTIQKKE